jgi:hypothetical protein
LNASNEFIIFEKNYVLIKNKLNILECQKISKYKDNSWEIISKRGKCYRFLSDDPAVNLKWFNIMTSVFSTLPNIVSNEELPDGWSFLHFKLKI